MDELYHQVLDRSAELVEQEDEDDQAGQPHMFDTFHDFLQAARRESVSSREPSSGGQGMELKTNRPTLSEIAMANTV